MAGPGHKVDRRLAEGDEVAGFQVLEVPGHSAGHLAFWRGSDGVLVLGDVLNNQNALTGFPVGLRAAVRLLHARPGGEPPVGEAPGRAGAQAGAVRPRAAAAGHEEVRGLHRQPGRCLAHSGRARRPPQAARGAQALRARRDRGARVASAGRRPAHSTPSRRATAAENFSIAVPPPNVTGELHMGHALNASIQDVLRARGAHAAAATPSGSTAPTTRASPPRSRSSSS